MSEDILESEKFCDLCLNKIIFQFLIQIIKNEYFHTNLKYCHEKVKIDHMQIFS